MAELNFQIFMNTLILLVSTGVAVGVETHVNIGDSLTINCSSTANTTGIHIWWFNDKIIFADKFVPLDIGVKNVRGDFKNGTSYLHFTRLTVRNAGNYSCSVGVTENCFYTLSVSVPHLPKASAYLLCMNKACPKILLLNTSVEYEFQCYTDTESPKEAILWKINDVPTSKGIENRTIPIHLYGENVTKLGSSLRILPRIEDKNITCRYGNISRVVFVHVFTEKIIDTYLVFVAVPAGSFVILLFSIIITAAVVRHRYSHPNQVTLPLRDITLNYDEYVVSEKDVKSFDENFEDYEDFETYYGVQEMAFHRHQLSFNNVIDIFLKASCWVGTLETLHEREEEVLISCIPAGATLEEKFFWEKQINTKLKIAEHKNILKTLGYCQEEGITYVIQDYFEVMPLICFLQSTYSNFKGTQSDFSSTSYSKYCYDVINGMGYLSQEKCFHPGLSVKKVLIRQGRTCKLHDFCLQKDGKRVLELFIKQDEDSFFRLAPENLTLGEYTTKSDVWAAGITMWEIFSGGVMVSSGNRKDDTLRLLTENFLLRQPIGCPAQIYEMMKLCWCTRCNDRPSFEDIQLMLENSQPSLN